MSARQARVVRFLLLWGLLALAACRHGSELSEQSASASPTVAATPIPLAPSGDMVRLGAWLGGPDPVSGKLRSGISTYYRITPPEPRAGQTVQVQLRFEDVVADDAAVKLTLGDGAQWAQTATNATPGWRLQPQRASEVTVQVKLPAGDSYLHVMSAQSRRPSVTSILLRAKP